MPINISITQFHLSRKLRNFIPHNLNPDFHNFQIHIAPSAFSNEQKICPVIKTTVATAIQQNGGDFTRTETRGGRGGSTVRWLHDRCHLPRKLRSSVTLTNLLRYTRQRSSVTGTAGRFAFRFHPRGARPASFNSPPSFGQRSARNFSQLDCIDGNAFHGIPLAVIQR